MTLTSDYIPNSLSISCVYYDTDISIFEKTLISIADAVTFAKNFNVLKHCELHIINNNPEKELLFQQCIEKNISRLNDVVIHSGHGNIGYGRANNIAIFKTQCKYHLILNPDIITEMQAIKLGLEYLERNPNVALVAPNVTNANHEIEYLAKRTPTFFIIFLRGLNNSNLNKIFQKKLDFYAYKDKIPSKIPIEIELASGCFMLCRSKNLKNIDGFSEKYFLYFEDFDISKRLQHYGALHYVPSVKIIHLGGYSSKKGIKHIYYYFCSFAKFRKT